MNPRLHPARLILPLSLILFLLASCAPATATQTQPPFESAPILPSATPLQPVAPTADAPTQDPSLAQPATQAPPPVATSRGPDLHATDPATVSLASGQYQFVEFFRFTWSTCRAMAPMVHGLEAKYFGKIKFSYLDADDPQTYDFQSALGFYYQPEIYFLDPNGIVLMKWVGFTSEADFEFVFGQFVQ